MTQEEEIRVQLNALHLLKSAGQWNSILQRRYDELMLMQKLMEGLT